MEETVKAAEPILKKAKRERTARKSSTLVERKRKAAAKKAEQPKPTDEKTRLKQVAKATKKIKKASPNKRPAKTPKAVQAKSRKAIA